jgi:hypothetical protein
MFPQDLNVRLNDLVSKEKSWFKESERFLAKIADCQKQQLEANEQMDQLATLNHRSVKINKNHFCVCNNLIQKPIFTKKLIHYHSLPFLIAQA